MQIAHLICVSATLWGMAVSAYDDPSKLQVFPFGTDAAILFTGTTGALVEVRFFIYFVGDTHQHIVILRISTLEAFGKTFLAPSRAGTLSSSSGSCDRNHSESFHDVKCYGVCSRSKYTYNGFTRFTRNL